MLMRKTRKDSNNNNNDNNNNILMYLDGIKLFAKNEKELETLIHAVRIYIQTEEWNLAEKNVPCSS